MPETLLSPETCTLNRAVYRHAVAFSTSAEAGEHRHPARRATGDPPGKTDSVGEAVGVSVSERCLFSRRAIGDPLGKTDSVAAGVGVSVSECCMGPSTIRFAYRDKSPAVSSIPAEAGELSHEACVPNRRFGQGFKNPRPSAVMQVVTGDLCSCAMRVSSLFPSASVSAGSLCSPAPLLLPDASVCLPPGSS